MKGRRPPRNVDQDIFFFVTTKEDARRRVKGIARAAMIAVISASELRRHA
jgi:hypothetical protein